MSAPQPDRAGEAPLPLAGVRILELGHTVMGPSCSMVLADLGADVIKVEPPEGDRTRANVGFGSALFPVFNRNKRSFCIDLKSDAGKRVLHTVLETADALIENFAPGTMDRLGLGYEALSRAHPRLIYCALKGFLSGPYEKRAALDEIVQFMGGLAYMTGPNGMPLRAGSSVVDIMGGVFGALGIMAALRERERTGRGQLVDLSDRQPHRDAHDRDQDAGRHQDHGPRPDRAERSGGTGHVRGPDNQRNAQRVSRAFLWRILPRL